MNFEILQEILNDWAGSPEWPVNIGDGLLDRICQILKLAHSGARPNNWHADLQPLIRQYLLRATDQAGQPMRLRVPAAPTWPDRGSWVAHGVTAMSVNDDFLLEANPWRPNWLDSGNKGVFADAFSDRTVRPDWHCVVDPFIGDATGFTHYSCQGQREAVRAAFLIPQGDTLMVNLPTGSGKSLVGQAPALVHRDAGHLTLFVVPTVALAIDQERAMQELFARREPQANKRPFAWYGGLSQELRVEIRQRLNQGTQRILFTSPEALTTSLLGIVSKVAQDGMLDYLVIDEAHLVTQWGDEFRPAFQILAGLRNNLLRLAPAHRRFRTLLLTATYTRETVETLASLFGPPERVQMVSAVHLRPEPQYWFYKAVSRQDKQERVLEALRHAPRPFILYVTQRNETTDWIRVLQQAGLQRIATFHGNTPDNKRREIIGEWVANRLDGVIATSAFGVGLDKSDVRTVIHATIPETLDRYYQEVGRGGRDGKHSASLLVFERSDWELPARLAAPALITEELGMGRWQAMWDTRQTTSEQTLWKIDIDAVPSHLRGGGDFNVKWNMRTLILMARAGLIALDLEANHNDMGGEPGEDVNSWLSTIANMRVRILDDGHCLPEVWERRITPSRQKTLEAAAQNLRMLGQLLPQTSGPQQHIGAEVGATLAQLYRIPTASHWPVEVVRVCGGCPVDRDYPTHFYPEPIVVPINRVIPSGQPEAWRQLFDWIDPALVWVFYDEYRPLSQTQTEIVQFANWLVQSCDVRELAIDPISPLARNRDWTNLYRSKTDQVVLHRSLMDKLEPYTPLARLTVLDQGLPACLIDDLLLLQRSFHIVLLPLGIPDPRNPTRPFIDICHNSLRLEDNILPVIIQ